MSDDYIYYTSLSSPYRNFFGKEAMMLYNVMQKKHDCGVDMYEMVNGVTTEFVEFPVYCDNRSCNNDGCMRHRYYQYQKDHAYQIREVNASMDVPKSWVFTGWKLPLKDLDKQFLRDKTNFLFKLCKEHAVSEFGIFAELKMDYKGNGYLHWHGISGGFEGLKEMRADWTRQIKYEYTLNTDTLAYYVSKYATKTPYYDCWDTALWYTWFVYKEKMHRFSLSNKYVKVKNPSDWYTVDQLIYECESGSRRGRMIKDGIATDFRPYIDVKDHGDYPRCVWVYQNKSIDL